MNDVSRPRCGAVAVEGAVLHYAVEGRGVPMLVLGSSVYYPRTFSRALRESCRLAFVDARHFANTDPAFSVHRIRLDTYLDDIDQMRAALGLERFALVGHSHHGNLALEYARRHPKRVSHLVLIGTPPCDVRRTIEGAQRYWEAHASKARKAILRHKQEALRDDDLAAMSPGEAFVAHYIADGPKYWFDPSYDASPLWNGVPLDMGVIEVYRSFFTDYQFGWDPSQLRAPVLAVMGRHDYAVPPTLWDDALPQLSNVTYRVLERSGHTPQLEEAESFDRTLLSWLQNESGESTAR